MLEKRETRSPVVVGGGGRLTGLSGGGRLTGLNGSGVTPLIPSCEREKEKYSGFDEF